MTLITEDQLRYLHTKHRSPYELEYVDHKVKLDSSCCYCWDKNRCSCTPRWMLQVEFYCSWCDKKCRPLTSIPVDQITPSIEDFFSEME